MSLKARSPAYSLRQERVEPSVEGTPHLSAQEDTVSYQLLKFSQQWCGLEQCFSEFHAHVNHPGILLTWRLWFRRSGGAWDAVFPTSFQVMPMLRVHGPHRVRGKASTLEFRTHEFATSALWPWSPHLTWVSISLSLCTVRANVYWCCF